MDAQAPMAPIPPMPLYSYYSTAHEQRRVFFETRMSFTYLIVLSVRGIVLSSQVSCFLARVLLHV